MVLASCFSGDLFLMNLLERGNGVVVNGVVEENVFPDFFNIEVHQMCSGGSKININ